MTTDIDFARRWARTGAICGLAGVADYIALVALPVPDRLGAFMAAAFGPLLSLGCFGLYKLLEENRRTVSLQIGAAFALIAGALVNAMLMVQLVIGAAPAQYGEVPKSLNLVHLGLDLSWDFYIGVATVLFGLNMLRHPRFGRIFGGLGIAVGAALLILNWASFPTPPANAGSFDVGPLVALWYTAASIQVLRIVRLPKAAAATA